jgi:4-amino-4-deoxy-L-arabinose transferase-like glycosyltransferase
MNNREKRFAGISQFFHTVQEIWHDAIINDPSNRSRAILSGILILTSLWIGLAYAKDAYTAGWQFWVWLVCATFICVILYQQNSFPQKLDIRIPLVLLASALILRIQFLNLIPGLFHVDESGVASFSRDQIYHGPGLYLNPFITGPSSQPSLYHYIIHYSMLIFGNTIFGERISSAIIGSLGVVATYFMIKSISGKRTALLASIAMVTYHFSIHWSRVGLNNIWDTLWVPLTVWGFVKGWKDRWPGGAVISGLAFGLSQYFYAGSKISAFILVVLVLIYWKQDGDLKRKLGFIATLMAVAVCIAGPLLMFALLFPEIFFLRTYEVAGWRPDAIQILMGSVNYWNFFWRQIYYSTGTYTIFPDPSGFYGPGIPLLIGPAALMFLAGIGLAIYKKSWIPITWIMFTTIFGGFLIGIPNGSPHYVVAIPAICWLTGLALDWIWECGYGKVAIGVLASILLIDLYFYFFVYIINMPLRDFFLPFPDPI